MERERVPEGWRIIAQGVEKMFVQLVNFTVERKNLNMEQLGLVVESQIILHNNLLILLITLSVILLTGAGPLL